MIQSNEQEKYVFSKERERELLIKAFRLYEGNQFQNLTDIFKINLEDLHRVERFYIQTCMLLYKNKCTVEKKQVSVKKPTPFKGGYVDVNLRFQKALIENVAEVSLNSIYPIIMMNLGTEISNHLGFTETLKELYIEYKNISANDIDLGLKDKVKEYINSVFGMLATLNGKAYIKSNIDLGSVTAKVRQIMMKLKNEFSGHYVSVDTDTIYLARYKEIEFRLEEYLNKLMDKYSPLEVNVQIHEAGIFFEKKRHIIFYKNGTRHIKGFKTIS